MALNFLLKRSGTASKRPAPASMSLGEIDLNYDAATGGLYYKDSAGNAVKVGPCQVSATAPNSAPAGSTGNSAGEFWYDTATSTLKVYNGTTWVETGGAVQGVTGTAPVSVDNTDPLNPVISVDAATTAASGVVQLNDTTSSTSTTEALTAAQGKNLQDQIDALAITSNLTFAGTLDTATGNMVTVSSAGTAAGFTIGSPLPAAAAGNTDYFVIVTVAAASYTPPGGSATLTHVGDWFLSDGTAWEFLDVGFDAPYASTTAAGIVELSTDAETQAGTDATVAVTPFSLQSKMSDSVSTVSGLTIASSTAVKDAYDAGIQGQTDAAAAQATADAAMPQAGGIFTGNVDFQAAQLFTSTSTTDFDPGSVVNLNATTNVGGDFTISGPGSFGVSAATADFINGTLITIDNTSTLMIDVSPTWDPTVTVGPALQVSYDNTSSGLTATEVQGAIDEVAGTANAAIPETTFTAIGEVIVGTAAGTYTVLAPGTAGQFLQSNGAGQQLTWEDVPASPISSYTANHALTAATPLNLLEWDTGVRMGTLVIMATDNSTNHAWANVSIGADTGVGISVVTTQSSGLGTFAVVAGVGGETIIEFTPTSTLASVDFVFQYTAAFGGQPTVL